MNAQQISRQFQLIVTWLQIVIENNTKDNVGSNFGFKWLYSHTEGLHKTLYNNAQ